MLNKVQSRYSSGFTLIELLVVLAMVTIIVSLSFVNISGLVSSTSLDETVELVISDIKRQQLRAMLGEQQQSSSRYGIHFGTNEYILFSGPSYTPDNSNNVRVPLPQHITFSATTLSGRTIFFSELSGEVVGYDSNADRITLTHSGSNEEEELEFNVLGVIQRL